MNAHNKVTFWISTYEKDTHRPIKAEQINTIACREKSILQKARRNAARKGWYIIHS